MSFILYCLGIFFWFYLLNHALITKKISDRIKTIAGPSCGYPISCPFCFAFHISWVISIFGLVPVYYIFCSPVITMFIAGAYVKIFGDGYES